MSPILPRRLLATQSDERLLELARAGHEQAFEALVRRYRRPLLRYCQRMLLPEARAEDAIQQALLSAWSALTRGDQVADARAWLYRIVHNTAVSALRKSGYDYEELTESLRGADAPQEDLERRIAVREALAGLATLPQLQREVLIRTAVAGESHEQVATSLSLSDGAIRGMVYRARAALRAAATAVTPPWIAIWAAGAGAGGGASLAQRIGEAMAPGGAGAAGLLLKGGAVAVTAGGLVTGAVLVPHHHRVATITESAQPGAGHAFGRRGLAEGGSGSAGKPDQAVAGAGSMDSAGGVANGLIRFVRGDAGRGGASGRVRVMEKRARHRREAGGGGPGAGSENHHFLGGAGGEFQRGGQTPPNGRGSDGLGHPGSGGDSSRGGGGARAGHGTGSESASREGGSRGSGPSQSDHGSGGGGAVGSGASGGRAADGGGSGDSGGGGSGGGSGSGSDGGGSGSGSPPTSVPSVLPGSGGGGGGSPRSGGGGDSGAAGSTPSSTTSSGD